MSLTAISKTWLCIHRPPSLTPEISPFFLTPDLSISTLFSLYPVSHGLTQFFHYILTYHLTCFTFARTLSGRPSAYILLSFISTSHNGRWWTFKPSASPRRRSSSCSSGWRPCPGAGSLAQRQQRPGPKQRPSQSQREGLKPDNPAAYLSREPRGLSRYSVYAPPERLR